MASTISTASSAGCDDVVSAEVQPLCKCGIPAKLRTSMTNENPRDAFMDVSDMKKKMMETMKNGKQIPDNDLGNN
ncbi:hypothetical protein CJ030_MR7G017811 [Morella rubra]|uniref:Uncharacterized protein n=1 Tax=Morella rubra TaxID=262757 RepID=A0A6A1UZ14_9ROSI|nr:hypothetical protein CJ030_MR7G017811 [Morella rubra]